MKAVIFYRKNGRPDSRILEQDRDFDEVCRLIARENDGEEDIAGIMDYKNADEWVREQLVKQENSNNGANNREKV